VVCVLCGGGRSESQQFHADLNAAITSPITSSGVGDRFKLFGMSGVSIQLSDWRGLQATLRYPQHRKNLSESEWVDDDNGKL